MWGIYMLSLSVLKHLFVNFRLLCENMKASKPIAIMFCLEYVDERKYYFEVNAG